MTVKHAEHWPLKTIAANTQKKAVFKFDFSMFTMETSHQVPLKKHNGQSFSLLFFFLCSGGQNFPLHVLSKQYEIEDLYFYRKKPTNFSQIKIYPLQILRVFLGQSGEKGWSEDEVCDLPSPLCTTSLSSSRTCTENTSGSVQGLWQVTDSWWMDQIQYLQYKMIRFRNEGDEWQWLRWWTDRGTFTAEGWFSFFFMKRIMNGLTTAGIHFQLWI